MKNMHVPWIAALLVMASASATASAQRPVVAVASFTNEAGSAASRWWGSQIGDQLGNVLGNELGSTGNFIMVERQQVGAVLAGNFSQSKNAPASKAVRAALIEATDYLDCVMVVRSRSCLARYDHREQKRRQSGRDLLDLD